MFEDLDKIDWQNIHHSHGTAEHFPEWLRTLAAGDDTEWQWVEEIDDDFFEEADSALYRIGKCTNHQGSIYENTPDVILFIIELLQIVSTKHQIRLLELLDGYTRDEQLITDAP